MTDELKKAIENHKKMWAYIKEKEEAYGYAPTVKTRCALKAEYIHFNKIEDVPYNLCFLCDYAHKMEGCTAHMCKYCPCLWGSELTSLGFYCECDKSGYVNWSTSRAEDIINLPIKPELL